MKNSVAPFNGGVDVFKRVEISLTLFDPELGKLRMRPSTERDRFDSVVEETLNEATP